MSRNRQNSLIAVLAVAALTLPTKADYRDDSRAIKASGGEDHTLVLTADKGAWACGPNGGYDYNEDQYYYGVLGTASNDYNLVRKSLVRVHGPDDVSHLEGIDDIDAGWKHSLALDINGFVWSWGWNSWGQLGVDDDQYRTTPVQVFRGAQADDPCQPSAYLKHIIGISAGRSGEHSLAVDEPNGYVYAWGRNQEGQCGNGESGTGYKKLVPARVHGVNDVDYLENIIAVSAGAEHGMALEAYDPCNPNMDGRVYTWGDNDFVLNNGSGVLGHGINSDSTTPVLVLRGEQDYNQAGQVHLKHIVAISAGWDHSMALEKYEVYDPFAPNFDPNHKGRVYTWGNNDQGWRGWFGERTQGGRLGDGSTTIRNTPVLVLSGEQDPNNANSPLQYIIAISAGEAHSMALDANGYVYCWGDNYHGQLGDGTNEQRLMPVKVVGKDKNHNGIHEPNEGYLENIMAISAGYWHSLAIDANGVIWTWGKGSAGRLGLGNKVVDCNIPHPIPVVYNTTQDTFAFAIQTAIDDANDAGDTLEASPGTYYENVNFKDKSIALKGSEPTDPAVVADTILDARYNAGSSVDDYYAVNFNNGSDSSVSGLTLTKSVKGGVTCVNLSSAYLSNCAIQDNSWDGIYLSGASLYIAGCQIRRNATATDRDYCGIYCESGSDVNIANCVVTGNAGSGILSQACDVNVTNSFIADNDVNGISCQGSSLILTNSIIEGNTDFGVYELYPTVSAVIANNIIRGNGDDGICSEGFSSGPKIKNNWIYDNAGSGTKIWNPFYAPDSNAVIVNNTIVGNDEYGVESYWASDVEIASSIIWGNGSSASDNLHAINWTFSVDYSCIEGGYAGTDNTNSDPRFVDADVNDFHLGGGSPCIDTGDPYFEPEPNETDIDGAPRIMNGRVDMGADEFWQATDFSGDGLVNFVDYAMLARHWHQANTDAGYSDAFDLWDDDFIDFNDVLVLCEYWLSEAPWSPTGSMPLMAGRSGGGMTELMSLQVAPSELTAVEKKPLIVEPVDVKKLLDWLAEVWLDPEVQQRIDPEAWLMLYESLKDL